MTPELIGNLRESERSVDVGGGDRHPLGRGRRNCCVIHGIRE